MSHGGKRPGAGRPKGSPNRPRQYISSLAREHAEKAIQTLVKNLADDNGTVRNNAARELIERGFGKVPTEITGEDGGPVNASVTVSFVEPD